MSRLRTALAVLVLGLTVLTASPAVAVDDPAPVVVDDTITVWPGGSGVVDALANDSDPAGDDLALCRLPQQAMYDSAPVAVSDGADYGLSEGNLVVGTRPEARGTHLIHYYVCNHTRLTPATLTVTVRPVQPVDVFPVAGKPGRLRVHNNNGHSIIFMATDRTGCKVDAEMRIPAHATTKATARRHSVHWTAYIGDGIADHGVLNHVAIDGPVHPDGNPHGSCSYSFGGGSMLFAG